MPNRVQQFRLRSLTGLALVSGFSLIVWIAIAMGVAQLQHHAPCDTSHDQSASQACKSGDR